MTTPTVSPPQIPPWPAIHTLEDLLELKDEQEISYQLMALLLDTLQPEYREAVLELVRRQKRNPFDIWTIIFLLRVPREKAADILDHITAFSFVEACVEWSNEGEMLPPRQYYFTEDAITRIFRYIATHQQ